MGHTAHSTQHTAPPCLPGSRATSPYPVTVSVRKFSSRLPVCVAFDEEDSWVFPPPFIPRPMAWHSSQRVASTSSSRHSEKTRALIPIIIRKYQSRG